MPDGSIKIICGDALETLKELRDQSVHCCITSPPYYGLRDYGCAGQIGLESTPAKYIALLVEVFREVRRVLRDDGTLWVNIGDSYAAGGNGGHQKGEYFHGHTRRGGDFAGHPKKAPEGLKPKDLIGIPWMLAFALRDDGWYLRQDIIWHKPNPMPESVKDRCTKAHEYVFMLSKRQKYWFDSDAMQEPSVCNRLRGPALHPDLVSTNGNGGLARRESKGVRNKRDVWVMTTQPCPEAHFATFPIELPEMCLRVGCPAGGIVLDPFCGAGTTALACIRNDRRFIGIELNADYNRIARSRIRKFEEKRNA